MNRILPLILAVILSSATAFGAGPQTTIQQEFVQGDTKFRIDQHISDDERSVMANLFLKYQLLGYFTSRKDISNQTYEQQLKTRDQEIGDIVALMKQRSKPVSFELNIPSPQFAQIIADPSQAEDPKATGKTLYAREMKSRIAAVNDDFSQKRWLKAIKELSSIRASIETLAEHDAVYFSLKQQYRSVVDKFFEDGSLIAPTTKEPFVKFNSSKDSYPGRAIRSASNQCIATESCPAKGLVEVLLIVENFNIGGINDAIKYWNAQGSHLDSAEYGKFVQNSDFFKQTVATYKALNFDDRKKYVEDLCAPLLSKVYKPWADDPAYLRNVLQSYLEISSGKASS